MGGLIECRSCGGLKQPKTPRCPHCRSRSRRSGWLTGALAVLGLGSATACGDSNPSYTGMDAYGLPPFVDSGQNVFGTDAYGAPPFRDAGVDAGPPDGGDGGDSD